MSVTSDFDPLTDINFNTLSQETLTPDTTTATPTPNTKAETLTSAATSLICDVKDTISMTSQSSAKDCGSCGLKIWDRYLLWCMGRHWHTSCLKCSCCQATLADVGASCFAKGGMILCRDDYLRYAMDRHTSHLTETTSIVFAGCLEEQAPAAQNR